MLAPCFSLDTSCQCADDDSAQLPLAALGYKISSTSQRTNTRRVHVLSCIVLDLATLLRSDARLHTKSVVVVFGRKIRGDWDEITNSS